MPEKDILVSPDSRGRIALSSRVIKNAAKAYRVIEQTNGTIILEPVVITRSTNPEPPKTTGTIAAHRLEIGHLVADTVGAYGGLIVETARGTMSTTVTFEDGRKRTYRHDVPVTVEDRE